VLAADRRLQSRKGDAAMFIASRRVSRAVIIGSGEDGLPIILDTIEFRTKNVTSGFFWLYYVA
jgi:hypothetical protein